MPLRPNKTPLFISLLSPCNMQDDFDHIVSWFIFKRWRHSWKPLSYSIVCSNKKENLYSQVYMGGAPCRFLVCKNIQFMYTSTLQQNYIYCIVHLCKNVFFSFDGTFKKDPSQARATHAVEELKWKRRKSHVLIHQRFQPWIIFLLKNQTLKRRKNSTQLQCFGMTEDVVGRFVKCPQQLVI